MQRFSVSPTAMLTSLWRNRALAGALIKREVVGRYRGSLMGILWSFFHPVLMLAVYTFVFSVVFKARWSTGAESKTEFALVLFAGMLAFNFFSDCVTRAPSLVLSNANYVKKVIFPLEILPFVNLGAAAFHLLVSLWVWLCFYVILVGVPHPTVLLFPLIFLPLGLFTLGVSWMLSSMGVYLRDVGHVVGIATTALLFLSPIFFPVSALPEQYQPLLKFNPLTPVIEQTRQALMRGIVPDVTFWFLSLAVGAATSWLGFAWFQKTRKGFADVL